MKKRIIVSMLGLTVLLAACGQNAAGVPEDAAGIGEEGTETVDEAAEDPEKETVAEEEVSEPETEEETHNYVTDSLLTTDLFEMTMPDEFAGSYLAEVGADEIDIFYKESVDAGYPGFVFSVVASPDTELYAGGMFSKVGELKTGDGKVYNVCKCYASEAQWEGDEMPEGYKKLFEATDSILENITGVNGGEFSYKAGTRGEELYPGIIARYDKAIKEKWDANKLEEEEMSPEIFNLINASEEPEKAICVAFADLSFDGIDELLVGDYYSGNDDAYIYDIYTMADGKPVHVVSGSSKNRYYSSDDKSFICNKYLFGAGNYGWTYYALGSNTSDLLWQYGYKYDTYENESEPWFKAYSEEEWEAVPEEEFTDDEKKMTDGLDKLDFRPLADFL